MLRRSSSRTTRRRPSSSAAASGSSTGDACSRWASPTGSTRARARSSWPRSSARARSSSAARRGDRVDLGPARLCRSPPDVPHDEGDRVRVPHAARAARLLVERESAEGSAGPRARRDRRADVSRAPAGASACSCRRCLACARSSPPLRYGEESLLARRRRPGARRAAARAARGSSSTAGTSSAQPRRACSSATMARASATALELAQPLADALDGSVTVLGIAADRAGQEALRESLARRRRRRRDCRRPTIRVRGGDAAEQIAQREPGGPLRLRARRRRRGRVRCGRRRLRRASPRTSSPRTATPLCWRAAGRAGPSASSSARRVGEPGKTDIRAGGWLARRLGAAGHAAPRHASRPDAPAAHARAHLERGVATLRELGVSIAHSRVRPAESPDRRHPRGAAPRILTTSSSSAPAGRSRARSLREAGLLDPRRAPQGSW